MIPTQPPRIAAWLLRRFGCSPNNDALIGDLNERYERGCSRSWYSHQAASAIVASFFKEIWTHKLLTVRVILVGWSVFYVSRYGFYMTWELLSALASWSKLWRHGWITIAIQIPELLSSCLMAGWLIAKLHRQSPKAMVLAYAAFFTTVQVLWIAQDLLIRGPGTPPGFLLYTPLFVVVAPLSILIGGGIFSTDLRRLRAALS